MSKSKIITSTILSIFLFTFWTINIPNEYSIFAQESQIETINSTGAQPQSNAVAQAENATDVQPQSSAAAAQAGNATDAQPQSSAAAAQAGNATDAQPQSSAAAAQAGNATSGGNETQAKPEAATISIGESFAQQGTLTSKVDPFPGHEGHQFALILPPRDDGAIYQGTLTFTASKPTDVMIIQNFANETSVNDAFYGGIATAPLGEGTVAFSLLTPQFGPIASASVPFAGNGLALHNIDGEPFAATYTVSGDIAQTQTFDSITQPPVTEAAEEDTGNGEQGDGGGDGEGNDDEQGDGGGEGDGEGNDDEQGDGGGDGEGNDDEQGDGDDGGN